MFHLPQRRSAVLRLLILVVPVVLALVMVFLFISENVILSLSKDRMELKSKNYSDYLHSWADKIIGELNIYKNIIDKDGGIHEDTFDMLSVSYGPHEEFPYGLYWGDENDNFYDASGWSPENYFPTQRSWYTDGCGHDKFAFGEPYIDARTSMPCVSATAKIDTNGERSVLAADVFFDYPAELVNEICAQEIENAFFVSRSSGMIIADSDPEWAGRTLDADIDNELYSNIRPLINGEFTGLTEVNSSNGRYFVCINKVYDVDWYFVTCMQHNVMIDALVHVISYIIIFGVTAFIILFIITQHALKEFGIADKEAKTDALTNLYNRDGFRYAVRNALKNNPNQGLMVMLDVDNFKRVNDRLGHPAGDQFLREFAALISEYFNRNKDMTARFGGDEFAVFVGRRMSREESMAMLNKFMRLFHSTFDEKYADQNLSISMGAAFVGHEGNSTLAEVYESADKALYRAKNTGKDKFIIH